METIRYGRITSTFQDELATLKEKLKFIEDNIESEENSSTHDNETQNVCRIHVHSRIFDWTQPPNKNKSTSGTGTGFVLADLTRYDDEVIVVTAQIGRAHV